MRSVAVYEVLCGMYGGTAAISESVYLYPAFLDAATALHRHDASTNSSHDAYE